MMAVADDLNGPTSLLEMVPEVIGHEDQHLTHSQPAGKWMSESQV